MNESIPRALQVRGELSGPSPASRGVGGAYLHITCLLKTRGGGAAAPGPASLLGTITRPAPLVSPTPSAGPGTVGVEERLRPRAHRSWQAALAEALFFLSRNLLLC